MTCRTVFAAAALAATAVAPLGAQAAKPKPAEVRDTDRPPAGMCRVWVRGVPASQQPAPTDCISALRNRPADAAVLFGDDATPARHRAAPPRSPAEAPRAAARDTVRAAPAAPRPLPPRPDSLAHR